MVEKERADINSRAFLNKVKCKEIKNLIGLRRRELTSLDVKESDVEALDLELGQLEQKYKQKEEEYTKKMEELSIKKLKIF